MLGLVRNGRRRPPVEIVQLDDPTPAPNEALVAVEASSLNRGELDLLQIRGDGWRPGQDLAGRVVQAAADGSSPPVGTRVVALVENGAWAERAAVPAARLAVLPDGVETSTAAALPLAGLTALRTVRLAGPVLGRELLVLGAGGGVGHLAVQLAVGAGAFVTAQVAADRVEEFTRYGSTAVHSLDSLEPRFDVVLDGLGGRALKQAVGLIRRDGTIVFFGGVIREPAELTIYDFVGHENATIKTFLSYASGDEASIAADLSVLARLVAARTLRPEIGLQLPLAEAPTLIQALTDLRVRGKAILTVAHR